MLPMSMEFEVGLCFVCPCGVQFVWLQLDYFSPSKFRPSRVGEVLHQNLRNVVPVCQLQLGLQGKIAGATHIHT